MKEHPNYPKRIIVKSFFVASIVLLTFISSAVSASCKPCSNPGSNSFYLLKDSIVLKKQINLYRIITSGAEADVKNLFQQISYNELVSLDSGKIVKALNRLNTKEKVTHTIWILEVAKTRSIDFRNYIYCELLKVDYSKPNILVKTLINNYFTNYKEEEDSLSIKVSTLHRRMIR